MRTLTTSTLTGALLAMLAACTAPSASNDEKLSGITGDTAYALPTPEKLRAQSCPDGAGYVPPSRIDIQIEAIPLAARTSQGRLPPGVRYAGGWILTSPHAEFGGLSGMELLADGNLLTVSDTGAFIWIGRTDGVPDGTGQIAYMKGQDGTLLQGKADGDSEGLALKDGLAYVSFERRHRVEAFDLERCGTAARSALVAILPDRIEGAAIRENSGAEALSAGKFLTAGYEQNIGGKTPLVVIGDKGMETLLREPVSSASSDPLVGMSNTIRLGDEGTAGSVVYSLRRDYNPILGNRLTVEAEYSDAGGSSRRSLFTLAAPMNVDNFEGLTVETLPDATHRLWIVSDNNFSDRQRTLLYAFDLVGEAH